MYSSTFIVSHSARIFRSVFLYGYHHTAQHCFAADAAGAAPDLGAIMGRRGTTPLVSIYGGRQRCR